MSARMHQAANSQDAGEAQRPDALWPIAILQICRLMHMQIALQYSHAFNLQDSR